MWCARYSEATHQDLAGYTTQLMGPLRLARRRGHSLTDGRLARIWVLAALVLRCEVLVLDGPIRAEHVAADVPVIERPGRHGTALVDQVVPGLFGHVDAEVGGGAADVLEGERAVGVGHVLDLVEPADRVAHVTG